MKTVKNLKDQTKKTPPSKSYQSLPSWIYRENEGGNNKKNKEWTLNTCII